jgi:thiamine-monophosphate kinase
VRGILRDESGFRVEEKEKMRISRLGEFGLIDTIRKMNPAKNKGVVIGVGDDTAVIRNDKSRYILMTTDTLVEKVHFNLKYFTFFKLGWKLLAVNLSDIAAMGGIPKYALVTLGLKKNTDVSDIKDLYAGIHSLARKNNVDVVGGDIVSSPNNLFFTMDLFGVAEKVVRRSGARPGDAVICIGKIGASSAGLAHLKKYGRKAMTANVAAHLMPTPMLKEGRLASKYATSMIDNSDGLARCLIEICRESKVGARIDLPKVPLAAGASLEQALDGGEDYNLILTAPVNKARSVKGGVVIGEVTRSKKIILVDGSGKEKILKDKGYEHF